MFYKRASTIVVHWDGPAGWIENYGTRMRVRLEPPMMEVLHVLSQWSSAEDVERSCAHLDPAIIRQALDQLIATRLVLLSQAHSDVEAAFEGWASWSPAASFFHQSTKDVAYVNGASRIHQARYSDVVNPPPPRPSTQAQVVLPSPASIGDLGRALHDRRTWRAFGATPVSATDLATILGLTWGTVGHLQLGNDFSLPLKTSPSGGACQSVEVYVAVRNVTGLDAGLYRYHADGHGLTRVGRPPNDEEITTWVGGQSWVAGASAVCFMTSVFERVQWKYLSPRAYRVILLEAGHLCQTFCLVATALALAPFCSAALADTLIEQKLGIDGIRESVLYAAGVGTRP